MLQNKFTDLRTEVSSEVFERNEEISTAVLAIVSKTHHFQIGAPGVAKSLLVDKIVDRIDLGEQGYFKYLMQNFTVPEEVFGPLNVSQFVDHSIYQMVTNHKLPVALIGFLDEIFKANSSILNTLLMIINEREFVNPTIETVPLMTLFSASNELPGDQSLTALWDRMHFRHEVNPIQQSSSFINMLQLSSTPSSFQKITLDELAAAQAEVEKVNVTMDVLETLNNLRLELKAENIEPTGRRWKESLKIIRAQAWMNGNTSTEIADIRPLIHVLWSEPDHRRLVTQIVLNTVSPLESQAHALIDDIAIISNEFDEIEHQYEGDSTKLKQALIEVHKKCKRVNSDIDSLKEQAAMAEKSDIPAIEELVLDFKAIGARLTKHFTSN